MSEKQDALAREEQYREQDVTNAAIILGNFARVTETHHLPLPAFEPRLEEVSKVNTIPADHDCTRCAATAACGFFNLAQENGGDNPLMKRLKAVQELTATNPDLLKSADAQQLIAEKMASYKSSSEKPEKKKSQQTNIILPFQQAHSADTAEMPTFTLKSKKESTPKNNPSPEQHITSQSSTEKPAMHAEEVKQPDTPPKIPNHIARFKREPTQKTIEVESPAQNHTEPPKAQRITQTRVSTTISAPSSHTIVEQSTPPIQIHTEKLTVRIPEQPMQTHPEEIKNAEPAVSISPQPERPTHVTPITEQTLPRIKKDISGKKVTVLHSKIIANETPRVDKQLKNTKTDTIAFDFDIIHPLQKAEGILAIPIPKKISQVDQAKPIIERFKPAEEQPQSITLHQEPTQATEHVFINHEIHQIHDQDVKRSQNTIRVVSALTIESHTEQPQVTAKKRLLESAPNKNKISIDIPTVAQVEQTTEPSPIQSLEKLIRAFQEVAKPKNTGEQNVEEPILFQDHILEAEEKFAETVRPIEPKIISNVLISQPVHESLLVKTEIPHPQTFTISELVLAQVQEMLSHSQPKTTTKKSQETPIILVTPNKKLTISPQFVSELLPLLLKNKIDISEPKETKNIGKSVDKIAKNTEILETEQPGQKAHQNYKDQQALQFFLSLIANLIVELYRTKPIRRSLPQRSFQPVFIAP